MSVTKILITGGPCAGKTTALKRVKEHFEAMDYTVLCVPESATELIPNGVAPWTCASSLEYQLCQTALQQCKEKVFERAAAGMKAKKILIVCDRGALDNLAYISAEDGQKFLAEQGKSLPEMRDGYGAIFHLRSAAAGAEEAYSLSNNGARTESVQEAAELDERLANLWVGHAHLRVIDNSTGFEEKMDRLIAEIEAFLGEPEPLEIERKYLIGYPDIAQLEDLPNCRRADIEQVYLKSADGRKRRIRRRADEGHCVYYLTEKRRITAVTTEEIECRLSAEEYQALLAEADPELSPIVKSRYCLLWENQYFEIDVYPFWKDRAVMEIELKSEDEMVRLPDFIDVIREVTDDVAYKNSSLAKTMGKF